MSTTLGVITTGIAAIIAVLTAGQLAANVLRLRHELFERRFEIFKTYQRVLSRVMREGRVTDEMFQEDYPDLVDAWQRSRFLFQPSLPIYLDEIRTRYLRARQIDEERNVAESYAEVIWLVDQTGTLIDRFRPSMALAFKYLR